MRIQVELLAMLEAVAEAWGEDLCQKLVVVGGCSTAVLITDKIILQEIRATDDVDVIFALTAMAQWRQLQKSLNKRGFKISSDDDVIRRLRLGYLKVEFMLNDSNILGLDRMFAGS